MLKIVAFKVDKLSYCVTPNNTFVKEKLIVSNVCISHHQKTDGASFCRKGLLSKG